MNLPIVGKTYDYFDDGKIRETRKMKVTITKIIPFDEINKKTLKNWKKEVKVCGWLYAKKTDYFVKGDLMFGKRLEKLIFVRTINGEWFSLGMWGGKLNVDESHSLEISDK